MDNMMSSIFGDPFGGFMGDMGMPLPIMGSMGSNALMPFMPPPQINVNRLMSGKTSSCIRSLG